MSEIQSNNHETDRNVETFEYQEHYQVMPGIVFSIKLPGERYLCLKDEASVKPLGSYAEKGKEPPFESHLQAKAADPTRAITLARSLLGPIFFEADPNFNLEQEMKVIYLRTIPREIESELLESDSEATTDTLTKQISLSLNSVFTVQLSQRAQKILEESILANTADLGLTILTAQELRLPITPEDSVPATGPAFMRIDSTRPNEEDLEPSPACDDMVVFESKLPEQVGSREHRAAAFRLAKKLLITIENAERKIDAQSTKHRLSLETLDDLRAIVPEHILPEVDELEKDLIKFRLGAIALQRLAGTASETVITGSAMVSSANLDAAGLLALVGMIYFDKKGIRQRENSQGSLRKKLRIILESIESQYKKDQSNLPLPNLKSIAKDLPETLASAEKLFSPTMEILPSAIANSGVMAALGRPDYALAYVGLSAITGVFINRAVSNKGLLTDNKFMQSFWKGATGIVKLLEYAPIALTRVFSTGPFLDVWISLSEYLARHSVEHVDKRENVFTAQADMEQLLEIIEILKQKSVSLINDEQFRHHAERTVANQPSRKIEGLPHIGQIDELTFIEMPQSQSAERRDLRNLLSILNPNWRQISLAQRRRVADFRTKRTFGSEEVGPQNDQEKRYLLLDDINIPMPEGDQEATGVVWDNVTLALHGITLLEDASLVARTGKVCQLVHVGETTLLTLADQLARNQGDTLIRYKDGDVHTYLDVASDVEYPGRTGVGFVNCKYLKEGSHDYFPDMEREDLINYLVSTELFNQTEIDNFINRRFAQGPDLLQGGLKSLRVRLTIAEAVRQSPVVLINEPFEQFNSVKEAREITAVARFLEKKAQKKIIVYTSRTGKGAQVSQLSGNRSLDSYVLVDSVQWLPEQYDPENLGEIVRKIVPGGKSLDEKIGVLIAELSEFGIPVETWGTKGADSPEKFLRQLEVRKDEITGEKTGGEARLVFEEGALRRKVNVSRVKVFYRDENNVVWQLEEYERVLRDDAGNIHVREPELRFSDKVAKRQRTGAGETAHGAAQRAIRNELRIRGELSLQEVSQRDESKMSDSLPGLQSDYHHTDYELWLTPDQYDPHGYMDVSTDSQGRFVWKKAPDRDIATDTLPGRLFE